MWPSLVQLYGTNVPQLKHVVDLLPQNVMTLIFHVYCSQELYQATDDTYQALAELETIFPTSAFLKTQRALLYYHSKGTSTPSLISYSVADMVQTSKKHRTYSQPFSPALLTVSKVSTITPTFFMSWATAPNSPSSPKSQLPQTNSALKHAA